MLRYAFLFINLMGLLTNIGTLQQANWSGIGCWRPAVQPEQMVPMPNLERADWHSMCYWVMVDSTIRIVCATKS